jgi:hypothetical protein
MLRILLGIFVVLHGLVHLLYSGQSWRLFELQTAMVWPDGSWALSRLLGEEPTRLLASVALALTAIGFMAGGIGILVREAWWRPLVIAAATLSIAIYLLLWDGSMQHLDDKGGIGVLIDIAILAAVLVFQWPAFSF